MSISDNNTLTIFSYKINQLQTSLTFKKAPHPATSDLAQRIWQYTNQLRNLISSMNSWTKYRQCKEQKKKTFCSFFKRNIMFSHWSSPRWDDSPNLSSPQLHYISYNLVWIKYKKNSTRHKIIEEPYTVKHNREGLKITHNTNK